MNIIPRGRNVLVKEVTKSNKGKIIVKSGDSTRYVKVLKISEDIKDEPLVVSEGDYAIIDKFCGVKLEEGLVLVDKSFLRVVVEGVEFDE